VWTNPRPDEYNYDRYGELIKNSVEVWVPSECTKAKLSKWWDIHPDKVKVILSAVPYWNYPDVQDKGYVMCALREIPDHWWGKFEQACEELNIPYLATKHLYTYADYQEAVAHCKFLVSPLYELSTGGLTLVEGYYLGKPCLLSDSPWHGGIDYMHDKATYFDHANFSDFKSKLQEMYTETPQLDIKECKEWVKYNFSSRKMMYEIWRRLETVYTGL
jgi:glycosyltransferase involved in cell wall biosynthesis